MKNDLESLPVCSIMRFLNFLALAFFPVNNRFPLILHDINPDFNIPLPGVLHITIPGETHPTHWSGYESMWDTDNSSNTTSRHLNALKDIIE